MTLNFLFIKPLTTYLTCILIVSSTSNICRTYASSSFGRTSSSASRVVSPPASTVSYGQLYYECTFQLCICSVDYVFMIDE